MRYFFLFDEVLPEASDYTLHTYTVNMIVTPLLLVAFILFTVWAVKKLMRSRMTQLNRKTQIQLLERRALHAKSSLYLIEVEGERFLIGDSHAGLHLISKLTPKDL